jgi:hypothetical protein
MPAGERIERLLLKQFYEKELISDTRNLRFEVFMAVTMKNGVFWVVTPCGSCKNRRFRGT